MESRRWSGRLISLKLSEASQLKICLLYMLIYLLRAVSGAVCGY